MMDVSTVPEIDPAELEAEILRGDDIVVVDSRDPATYASWHLDSGAAPLVNIPEASLEADPAAALANVPADAHVRVICAAGAQSRRVTTRLQAHFRDVHSVRSGLIGWSRLLVADDVPVSTATRIVQFRRQARGCLSYLVASGGEALVVDPAPDVAPYVEYATRLGVRIVRVFDTHVHADHLSGAPALARATGATLQMSAAALARGVRFADEVVAVRDGDALAVGDARVEVIALPGHTSDMTGLLIDGVALIGGDCLFTDSVARPDLEVGDQGAAAAASVLHRTLHDRVLTLPGATAVLPAHYAGGRRTGPVATTVADARRDVQTLGLDADAFATEVLAAMPPRPANYERIIATNLGEPIDDDDARRLEVGANNCAANRSWAV
jgi:glyoxylase-like metal-dependent hydrolase (beta-lactamase superfamily II)/rhodanese-related sulfurtransferase